MSKQQASNWLKDHSHIIPALSFHHEEINRLLELENQTQNIVKVAISDPGLSLALLSKVNTSRGGQSGRDIVELPKVAISLLGDKPAQNLFKTHAIAEQQITDSTQLFLFQQLINRSFHNMTQVEKWAEVMGHQQLEALKSAAMFAYLGETLCCLYDHENYLQYLIAGPSSTTAIEVFGFEFDDLTRSVCDSLHLPEFINQSLASSQASGQRARLLSFTAAYCLACESGWHHSTMTQLNEQFAEYLKMPADRVIQKIHLFAIDAARLTIIPEAWQPASRLVLINDQHWAVQLMKAESSTDETRQSETAADEPIETQKQEQAQQPHKPDTATRIRGMINNPETTQSQLLSVCINGLHKDLGLTRACLLLISKDRKTIQNRLAIGLEEASPFRHYKIDLNRAGLLKILINKPQAVWINNDSFKKYQSLIPESLLANIMTNNFMAMSLFIGDKPVGIIYADLSATTENIDKALFTHFKQLISLTSKALTFMSKT